MAQLRSLFGVVSTAVLVLMAVGTIACGPKLSSRSSAVLNQLGQAASFSGGDCSQPQAMLDAYLEEIGRRPSEALATTVPKFARRAAAICGQSHPTIKVSKELDVSAVAAIFGGSVSDPDGSIPLESWLRANVDHGKVVSLTLDLAKVTR